MIYGAGSVASTADINNKSATSNSTTDPAAAQDRFLKLLVAQLNNQDPMNPMDNAQMTSQMAQINTVTGIQQLNKTMESMAGQFTASSTVRPMGRRCSVVNSTPPLPIFRVFPAPTITFLP